MRSIINISLPQSLAQEVKREVRKGKFASTSEFFRHMLRLWNTEKLYRSVKKADRDFKKGKNWRTVNSMRDLM